MTKLSTLLVAILFAQITLSQFAIGTQTITYNDPDRTGGVGSGAGPGRQIECAVYYPATSAGTNATVASGQFPIIVFGHGFAMEWSAYQNIWQHLVPQGYIMIFPKTEGGLFPAPSHNDFGLDLALVSEKLLAENVNTLSPFYQKINGNIAIMGHSMGGGATILAAQNNTNIKTIIGLAPAETNPSAIAAAENVTVPALILSGSSDGVTPPGEHHIPIYEALDSECKSFVSLTGGAHCYFANTNVFCDFGEGSASTGITLSRIEQQAQMNSLITPWLNYYLKDACLSYTNFMAATASTNLVLTQNCTNNPLMVTVTVTDATNNQSNGSAVVTVSGNQGAYTLLWSTNTSELNNVAPGEYTLTYTDANCTDTLTVTIGNSNVSTNLFESDLNVFFVYPNPASTYITLSSEILGLSNVTILDAVGRIVYEESGIDLTNYTIQTADFGTGTYVIRVENAAGLYSNLFVKK
jgi:dienelactone hydrolase